MLPKTVDEHLKAMEYACCSYHHSKEYSRKIKWIIKNFKLNEMELIINSLDRKRKETIKDCSIFEELCNEKLGLFVGILQTDKRYTYFITEDIEEDYPEGAIWAFTHKGTMIYKRFIYRLYKIGLKYFSESDMFSIDLKADCVIDE